MNELVKYFQNKEVASVLDVGCGSGDFIKVLTNVFPQAIRITGIDPFEAPLENARERLSSTIIEFIQMGSEQMNFDDNTFDVVSISFAMHHLSNISGTFNEMKRVLKPNGWLIVNEVVADVQNKAQETHKMLHHLRGFVDRLDGIAHHETYTKSEIFDIVCSNGICVEHSFMHLKMKEPTIDAKLVKQRLSQLESIIVPLEKHGFFEGKKILIDEIRTRLKVQGFQIPPSVVLIGRKA